MFDGEEYKYDESDLLSLFDDILYKFNGYEKLPIKLCIEAIESAKECLEKFGAWQKVKNIKRKKQSQQILLKAKKPRPVTNQITVSIHKKRSIQQLQPPQSHIQSDNPSKKRKIST